MIDEMACGYGTLRTTVLRISHLVSCKGCAEVTAAPDVSSRCAQRSQKLQNSTILIVNLAASRKHLHH